jgi:hypothetical protein
MASGVVEDVRADLDIARSVEFGFLKFIAAMIIDSVILLVSF